MSHYLWARLSKATDYYTDGTTEHIARLVAGITCGQIRVRCGQTGELIPWTVMATLLRLWNKAYPSQYGWPRGCNMPFDIELSIDDVERCMGAIPSQRRRGRPKGTGPNQSADLKLVREMNKLVSSRRFTVRGAAKAVALDANGNSEEAKVRRLERAYRTVFS